MNTLPSSALLIYFKDYEQYHRNQKNKMTHLIGLPAVVFSLLGLLAHVILWMPSPESLFQIDLGLILMLIGCAFSFKLDYKLAIPFSLYSYLNYLLARHLSLSILTAIQIIGWTFQFWGHLVYEKRAPALLTSIEHIFIGPMWFFSWITGYYKPAT